MATVEQRYDELVQVIEPRLKTGWRFERLMLADRLVLLLGVAELLATDRGGGAVAGWTAIADLFGEPASPAFVNGVLGGILRSRGG